jgi:hypothetical protein
MSERQLLTTREMAEFANAGMLRKDNAIPKALCAELRELFDSGDARQRGRMGGPLTDVWDPEHAIARTLAQPQVRGMIESLVGPAPLYDHHAVHTTKPGSGIQYLHADAEIDIRPLSFDIQLSIFPQDTPLAMGGTRFLPGSQFRHVHETMVGRYQHVNGMVQSVCDAGTVVAWHHNLWHGAQPNRSDHTRYMFKLRLNPTVPQQLLWDTADLDDPEIPGILTRAHPWHGQQARVEIMQRIRFWRFLTDNPSFDVAMWWGRVEADPAAM